MSALLVGLLAETFIHPGSDQDVGVIDNPVARESSTGYPFIAGSSMKGALKDRIGNDESLFGKHDNAGSVLISDARLLLLPVRSLTSAYKWATCPMLIERLQRDLKRNGLNGCAELPKIKSKTYLGKGDKDKRLFLEERNFQHQGNLPDAFNSIKKLIAHSEAQNRLEDQLVFLSNDDFSWFAQYALPVQARNQLDDKKQSRNLWYEEYLPPDTLMYFVMADRNSESNGTKKIEGELNQKPYIQIGGNETVGQGWFSMAFYGGGS